MSENQKKGSGVDEYVALAIFILGLTFFILAYG